MTEGNPSYKKFFIVVERRMKYFTKGPTTLSVSSLCHQKSSSCVFGQEVVLKIIKRV